MTGKSSPVAWKLRARLAMGDIETFLRGVRVVTIAKTDEAREP